MTTKIIPTVQIEIQSNCGIARMSRKKTVRRFRSRSSSTTSRTGCASMWCASMPYSSHIRQTEQMAIDKETAERIEQPVDAEAERETRLTPTEATARMRINVPVRGNRKL